MKLNKIILGFLVVLTIVLIPSLSVSKDNSNSTEIITLTKNNTIILDSQVDGDSASHVIGAARNLDSKLSGSKPIYLFLNTPGGSIQSGLEMIEALNGLGRPVNTITLFAASMGFQLVQQLGDRLVLKNGVLMSHHARGEFDGEFGGSRPSQMDSRYQLYLDRVRELDEQTVKRTKGKQTYDSYTKAYDHEFWLSGTRAVQEGYADRVVMVKCDSSLDGATTKHAAVLGFDVAYDVDNCPINTAPTNVRLGQAGGGGVLSVEMSNKIKAEFLSQFENKQKQSVPMTF